MLLTVMMWWYDNNEDDEIDGVADNDNDFDVILMQAAATHEHGNIREKISLL